MRILLGLVAIGIAAPLRGQTSVSPQCPAQSASQIATRDACQKVLDVFAYVAPQLGAGMTGGNAVAGSVSTLRPGQSSFGLRVNGVRGRIPDVESVTASVTGAVSSRFPVKELWLPVPTVDAAIGVSPGIPVADGVTRMFGVDVVLNVSYVPSWESSEVSVGPADNPLKFGIGARVALITEGRVTPGVVLSYLRRDLPVAEFRARSGSDSYAIDDFQVRTSAWRGVLGKRFGPVALATGAGHDTYETIATASVAVSRPGISATSARLAATQKLTRDNAFASIAFELPVLSLVGEYGRIRGGRVETYNTFDGDGASAALDYASVGLRFRFR